jgi:NitT/TauT family transport system permease protein
MDAIHPRSEPFVGLQRLSAGLGTVLIGVCLLAVWQLASALVFVVPAPAATLGALRTAIGGPEFWTHVAATAQATALAFAVSLVLGVLLGVLLGLSDYWRAAFEPLLLVLHVVPKVIIYPLILMVFGIGLLSAGLLGALLAVFPLIITVMAAVKELNPVYLKVARVAGATPAQTLTKVFIPAIRLPLVVSVRLAFSLALVGVVIGEVFAARAGLGRLVRNYYSHAQYPEMMAIVLLLVGLSLAVSLALWTVEQRLRRTG